MAVQQRVAIGSNLCNLLAVDADNCLVIIELKNSEDRYLVQQLTRYYDALNQFADLPFTTDTTSPRLLAIAPSFHADTLTDCRYSPLAIERLSFCLTPLAESICLTLHDASGHGAKAAVFR